MKSIPGVVVALLVGTLFAPAAFGCPFAHPTYPEAWRYLDRVSEERETFHMPEVSRRIQTLGADGDGLLADPEKIALQVALMDALALLEWLVMRDAGEHMPQEEWQYLEQHPHRAVQRQKVFKGLQAHPGDPFLTRAMMYWKDIDPTFMRHHLELAVQREPSCAPLRERLAGVLQQQGANFKAAKPH